MGLHSTELAIKSLELASQHGNAEERIKQAELYYKFISEPQPCDNDYKGQELPTDLQQKS